MSLKEQLNQDLKNSMKSGDKRQTETLRLLRSAIKYAEIEMGHELDDEEVLTVINKQAKQRQEAIAMFQEANRTDLIEKETAELAILESYLPAQISEAEIREKARAVIAELGVTDSKEMGPVMKRMMAELKGQADGKLVNQVVRELLQG